jgi:hypothetical protein
MAVFVSALLSALVIGMLRINTEEIQIAQNHIRAAEAMGIAEAGLNAALARLRQDPGWDAGFAAEPFAGGSFMVTIAEGCITSVGTSERGFVARVEADVVFDAEGPPHIVSISSLRVNE